jgi:hypothetical protein
MYLHVRVIEAADVPPMDPNGLSDPFVKMYMSDKKKDDVKTKTVPKTLTPKWNQDFTFSIRNSLPGTALHMSLYDEDPLVSDKISDIDFPFQQLPAGKVIDQWLDLNPWRGVSQGGRLHVKFHVAGASEVPFTESQAPAPVRVSIVAAAAPAAVARSSSGPVSPFAAFDLSVLFFVDDELHPESDGSELASRVARVANGKGFKSVNLLPVHSSTEECREAYDKAPHGPKSIVLLILSNDTTKHIKVLPDAINNTNFVVSDVKGVRLSGVPVVPELELGMKLKNPIDFLPLVAGLAPKVAIGKDADLFLGNYAYGQGLARVGKTIGGVVRFSTPSRNAMPSQEQAKFVLLVAEYMTKNLK